MKQRSFVPTILFALCAMAVPAASQNRGLDAANANRDGVLGRDEFLGIRDGLSIRELRGDSKMISSGAEFSVRSVEIIDSKTDFVGQLYLAVIERDVFDNRGALAIPKGSDAELVLQRAKGGSMAAVSQLVLDLEAVTVAGMRYLVRTGDVEKKDQQGLGANGGTKKIVGRGWAQGALNGAIAVGEKGTVVIAGAGVAAVAEGQIMTKGHEVRVPAETVLNFKVEQSLRLEPTN